MVAIKRLPYIIIEQIIFSGPLGLLILLIFILKIEFFIHILFFLVKPLLGGVAGVAHVITGHEQIQLSRVCYSNFFDVFLASKDSNYSELIYVLQSQIMEI